MSPLLSGTGRCSVRRSPTAAACVPTVGAVVAARLCPAPDTTGAFVRLIRVPASMALLGDANWWLPRWMDRLLPQIHLEGTAHPVEQITPDPQIAVQRVER